MARSGSEMAKRVGQMLCVGFDGPSPTPWVKRFLAESGGGGTILFRRNIESPEQLLSLNIALAACAPGAPPYGMIDQEGGAVLRLGEMGSPVPPMAVVGKAGDERVARRVGRLLGQEVRALGFNVDCAPVLDVHTNPDNPIIGDRAFSHDAERVGRLGAAMIEGIQSQGVLACGKHFPGHGDTAVDSHLALPTLEHDLDRLQAVELVPFRHVIEHRPPAMIMTAHILVPAIDSEHPATLSPAIIRDLLRDDLGYNGVVVTDDLEMRAIDDRYAVREAVRLGLLADVDLFLICHEEEKQQAALEELTRLVVDGEISEARVSRSLQRIARSKDFLRGLPTPTPSELTEILRCEEHMALVNRLMG